MSDIRVCVCFVCLTLNVIQIGGWVGIKPTANQNAEPQCRLRVETVQMGFYCQQEASKLNRCILGEVFWQEDTSRRNNQCRLSVTSMESRDPTNVIHESLEIKSSLYGVLTSKGTSRSWWRVDEGAGVKCWTV